MRGADADSAPTGIFAGIGKLIKGRPSDVEQHPADDRQEESSNDAHTIIACTSKGTLSTE